MADPAKKQSHRFYNSKAWRDARAAYLADHPLCVRCEAEGMLVTATVVDHIVEINSGGAPLDSDNFQPLCASHHARKTRADGHAW